MLVLCRDVNTAFISYYPCPCAYTVEVKNQALSRGYRDNNNTSSNFYLYFLLPYN